MAAQSGTMNGHILAAFKTTFIDVASAVRSEEEEEEEAGDIGLYSKPGTNDSLGRLLSSFPQLLACLILANLLSWKGFRRAHRLTGRKPISCCCSLIP